MESSGRLPIGMLSGTTTNYGDYDQCLSTTGHLEDGTNVFGKYCFLNIRPPLPPIGETLNLKGSAYENTWVNERVGRFARMYGRLANGLCIPSVCSDTEMTQLLRRGKEILEEILFNAFLNFFSQSFQ